MLVRPSGSSPEGLSLVSRCNSCSLPYFPIPSIQSDFVCAHSVPERGGLTPGQFAAESVVSLHRNTHCILLLVQLIQNALYIPDKNGGILDAPKRTVVLQLPTPSRIGE